MSAAFDLLLSRLRAIAEPSRLRLLAILARGEFSVSELTAILGQSQPRVSRHLKLLDDCGLLERFREQHWMYYRVAADTGGAASLSSAVDRAIEQLRQDGTLRELSERRFGGRDLSDLTR